MLARRFTIVCLIAAIFGMALAILVAEAERNSRSAFSRCTSSDWSSCDAVGTAR